jgi:hypothetical protein
MIAPEEVSSITSEGAASVVRKVLQTERASFVIVTRIRRWLFAPTRQGSIDAIYSGRLREQFRPAMTQAARGSQPIST